MRAGNNPFALSGRSMPARGVFDAPMPLTVFELPACFANVTTLPATAGPPVATAATTAATTIVSARLPTRNMHVPPRPGFG